MNKLFKIIINVYKKIIMIIKNLYELKMQKI